MTHAMVLTAVHLDKDGKPVRWRVENSWSEMAGTAGYFVMSDKWMDEFCYQAVIDPALVHKDVRDVLKQEPKVLPLWYVISLSACRICSLDATQILEIIRLTRSQGSHGCAGLKTAAI